MSPRLTARNKGPASIGFAGHPEGLARLILRVRPGASFGILEDRHSTLGLRFRIQFLFKLHETLFWITRPKHLLTPISCATSNPYPVPPPESVALSEKSPALPPYIYKYEKKEQCHFVPKPGGTSWHNQGGLAQPDPGKVPNP